MSELSVNLLAGTSAKTSISSDQILMQLIASGDESALEQLIQLHGQTLARLVGRLVAWHSDCDDIYQEVLLAVWKQAGSYRGEGSLEGWLKRLAANRCRNHFRTRAAIQRKLEGFATWLSMTETVPAPAVFGPDSDEKDKSESRQPQDPELRAALQQLKPDDRTAIVLFYMEELSGDEVADVLGIRTDTLHVKLHRARKKIKRLMQQATDE